MEYGTIDWDAEYWIEAVAQYDTRMVWNNIGRTADGKPKSTISFTHVFKYSFGALDFPIKARLKITHNPLFKYGKLENLKVNWME